MDNVYVGIDVAFAKKKRLPIVACRHRGKVLCPLPLRRAKVAPPVGEGNARILNPSVVEQFASKVATYLQALEAEFRIRIRRIAVDAPRAPRRPGTRRRECEVGLDERRIRYITTPSQAEFANLRERAAAHLDAGGPESRLPGANQLWMLVGFGLFRTLGAQWECLEVFPQAIAAALQTHGIHKSRPDGLLAQLGGAATYTRWPAPVSAESLSPIAYGARHDKLDAYLAAWAASLDEAAREAIGRPPMDVIWVPRLPPRD